MRLFGIAEAEHFCSSFSSSGGRAKDSIDAQYGWISSQKTLVEGTAAFNEYRDCSLRDVERCLFLGASQYRRALDLMTTVASVWALVTAYYGIWYLSRSLLGMFGVNIFTGRNMGVVYVEQGAPGSQRLIHRPIQKGTGSITSTYRGPHRVYWDIFYRSVVGLQPMVDQRLVPALRPVQNSVTWLIDNRNAVNYDSKVGLDLARAFEASFAAAQFPGCLPGALGTEYGVLELMLELAFSYASQFGLRTDAIDVIGPSATTKEKIELMIYEPAPPDLVGRTKKNHIVP